MSAGLVEVTHHDDLLNLLTPLEDFRVEEVSRVVRGRVVGLMIKAGGHVGGHQQQLMAMGELDHCADEATSGRAEVATNAVGETEREQQAHSRLVM
jgi:hypothetical protein